MNLVSLFNGYATKSTKSEAFQTDDVYEPIGTHLFANQLESARANYSMIAFMPREDCKRNTQNADDDTQNKHHLKYLFVDISAKDKGETYQVTVSEIATVQQKHRLYGKYFKNKAFKGEDSLISLKVSSDTRVLVYKDTHIVIPTKIMQSRIV